MSGKGVLTLSIKAIVAIEALEKNSGDEERLCLKMNKPADCLKGRLDWR